MSLIRVLMIGDIVGDTGRQLLERQLVSIRNRYKINVVVVNGENSAHGRGITPKIADFLRSISVDVITTGNHVWAKRDIYSYIQMNKFLLRPANFQPGSPGAGLYIHESLLGPVAVINVQGRVFMKEFVECPFRTMDSLLLYLKDKTKLIFVDFHAEATAEKLGMAFYLDGKVSAVVGTHTHVQTSDERILPRGTAYITDLGMCGSLNSMLGQKKEPIIQHLITQMPAQFEVDTEAPLVLSGVVIETDIKSGLSEKIERVYIVEG